MECGSYFERLAQVATLRERPSGRYREPLAETIFGESQVDRKLRRLHLHVFREWLALNLERQLHDLDQYLPAPEGQRREVLASWARFSRYEELIPPGAILAERLLFVSDLDLGLELLRLRLEPAPEPRALLSWRLQYSS